MNVIHFSCVAPPETGGIGQSAYEIVARLNKRGVDATLCAPVMKGSKGTRQSGVGYASDQNGVDPGRRDQGAGPSASHITRLPAFIRYGNAAALGGSMHSIMNEADIIHLHYPFFGTAEKVAQYCQWKRKPFVMTFHMDATGGFFLQTLFDMYRLLAQPAILLASRAVFVSSLDYATQSSIASFVRSHPDRVIKNPFGVDTERFYPRTDPHESRAFRHAHGIPEQASLVGFVGGMDMAHAFKGIPVLLEAMKALSTDVHALLVGDGNRRVIYEAKARELGVASRCHFVGRLMPEDLGPAYRSMDMLVFPSTNGAEAFGLVAAEAAACGIPVIASNLHGVRTVVLDGETGILTPPGDADALGRAISRLFADANLCRRYGDAALRHAREHFNWDRHVDSLLSVYRSLCVSPS